MAAQRRILVGPLMRADGTVSRRSTAAPRRLPNQDIDMATKMACDSCRIDFYVPQGSKPACPLCDAEKRIEQLQQSMAVMRNQLEMAENHNRRMASQVDLTIAIREALEVTGPEDMAFIKSVLYRYREDQSAVKMRPTYGRPAGSRKNPVAPNGFLVEVRGQDPEAHLCTSVGGLALAAYYEEALRIAPDKGLKTFVAAAHRHLQGGIR